MDFNKGDRVINEKAPDWGIGEIIEHIGGNKYLIFFVGAGEKQINTDYASLKKQEGKESIHPLLDNLKISKKHDKVAFMTIDEMVKLFYRYFPKGFYDDEYLNEERKYKYDAHLFMKEHLNKNIFEELLNDQNTDEICNLAMKAVNKTNLIFPNEKMALNDGLKIIENRELFSKALYNLVYGDFDISSRFMQFADLLYEMNAAKWTNQTYFLFITHPDKHIFMKPTITQYAAEAFGFEINYKSELNWNTYERLLLFTNYISDELSKLDDYLKPRDMIDVQGFMWCATPGKYY